MANASAAATSVVRERVTVDPPPVHERAIAARTGVVWSRADPTARKIAFLLQDRCGPPSRSQGRALSTSPWNGVDLPRGAGAREPSFGGHSPNPHEHCRTHEGHRAGHDQRSVESPDPCDETESP